MYYAVICFGLQINYLNNKYDNIHKGEAKKLYGMTNEYKHL